MSAINFDSPFDCIIVGGGPAGLTCSIFLGRYLRRVLVMDDSRPRNYASRGIHGFLGQHGIPPSELLAKGREEARAAGAEIYEGRATRAEKVGDLFEVETAAGTARARRLVLAYGLRDIPPDIPDFERYYGTGIFHCPDCDGYEIRGKRVGVIGSGRKVAGLTLELALWTKELTVLTNGDGSAVSAEELSKLLAQGIPVIEEKITGLTGEGDRLCSVRLASGKELLLDALFFTIGVERSSDLAEQLGCTFIEDRPCLDVDAHMQTSVEGVYAIGDLSPGSQLAITSAADGAIAGIAINKSLLPPAQKV